MKRGLAACAFSELDRRCINCVHILPSGMGRTSVATLEALHRFTTSHDVVLAQLGAVSIGRSVIRSHIYRLFPNNSCHLPLVAVAGVVTSLSPSGTSSIVSCTVAMAFTEGVASSPPAGQRSTSELDVFFCRREYVLSGVLRRAAVSEDVMVMLCSVHACTN